MNPTLALALNAATAGSAIPAKFSLAGDQGLDILAAGSPTTQKVDCQTLAPAGPASATKPADKSGLSADYCLLFTVHCSPCLRVTASPRHRVALDWLTRTGRRTARHESWQEGKVLEYLFIGSGFAFAAAVSPGPLQAFLLSSVARKGWKRTFVQAATVNLLNPNVYLSWSLVLGPAVLAAWRAGPANAVGLVVAFYATMVTALACTILLFGTTRFLGPRGRRALILMSAITLAALGVYQLVASLLRMGVA